MLSPLCPRAESPLRAGQGVGSGESCLGCRLTVEVPPSSGERHVRLCARRTLGNPTGLVFEEGARVVQD